MQYSNKRCLSTYSTMAKSTSESRECRRQANSMADLSGGALFDIDSGLSKTVEAQWKCWFDVDLRGIDGGNKILGAEVCLITLWAIR
jgi:hypothetical protein